MKLAVAGNQGSFSHQAGQLYSTGHEIKTSEFIYAIDSAGVFQALAQQQAEIGIVPIYNTSGGLVTMTLQAMGQYSFHIVEWFNVPIQQCVLALANTTAENIHTITSHPQALAQCKTYLQHHFPRTELREYIDTAQAATDLATGQLKKNVAVIAPLICAKIYGLQVLAENIQDDPNNTTTFLVVEPRLPVETHGNASLSRLRQSIDQIDEQIIQLIGKRFQLVRNIKQVKHVGQLPVQDPQREAKLLLRLNELSHKYNVPLEVIVHVYDFLMDQSREIQKQ